MATSGPILLITLLLLTCRKKLKFLIEKIVNKLFIKKMKYEATIKISSGYVR